MLRRTTSDIRRANRLDVLRRIYAAGSASRQDIARRSELSFATIANVVNDLLGAGVIVEDHFVGSGSGRPRAVLTPNGVRGLLVGVDVAETYVHAELFDLALRRLHAGEHPIGPETRRPAEIAERIARAIDALLAEHGAARERVLGVGVSVPGQVAPQLGVSVFAPGWDWHDVPMLALLQERIGLPLYLDNPLMAGTVAELWSGAGREAGNLVCVTVGTGVGAGVVIGGSLYRGTTDAAGEWGHSVLVYGGRACRCGSRGCVEAYVGAPGIMETLRELDPGSELLCGGDQTACVQALADSPDAGPVITRTAGLLGAALAGLVNIINPETVVLSSWVARSLGPRLLPELRESVAAHALDRAMGAVRIVLSDIPGNAVSLGAATFALEGFLDAVISPGRRT
ncbi:ROK family transcriptional regulator [Nonomuraea phyllanthi]|uniref:ROK family transcriptional regulator n=1 Tax=Nonomuraea phyllanthi TaxID=2219224 RepID=UPI001D15DDF2|nr:ROK family transcriptional regulator [Nonomuraea phyllanthi]